MPIEASDEFMALTKYIQLGKSPLRANPHHLHENSANSRTEPRAPKQCLALPFY